MKSVNLKAYPRALAGRNGTKKVRRQGRIPAVIYGAQRTPQSLEVDQKELETLMHHSISENLLVDLSIDQDDRSSRLALLQEVQHNPLSGKVVHVDLHEVDPNEPVTVQVPVETVGEPIGVKQGGGTLEHVVFKIRVRALPKNLPEFVEVDVSHLDIGSSLHLGEIKLPEGVEALGDKSIPILAVNAPKAEEVEVAAEAVPGAPGAPVAAAATTPAAAVEMIKEKKEQPAAAGASKPAAAGKK